MQALGVQFLDTDGRELPGLYADGSSGTGPGFCTGADLAQIRSIDLSGMDPLIRGAEFTIMCDVTNLLCGETGATYTFGKQKAESRDIKRTGSRHAKLPISSLCQSGVNMDEVPEPAQPEGWAPR